MALDPRTEAATAFLRFGFGARPRDLATLASDPRGALLAELEKPGRLDETGLPTAAEAARVVAGSRQEDRTARFVELAEAAIDRQRAAAASKAGADAMASQAPANAADAMRPPPNPGPRIAQQIYLAEAAARFGAAFDAEIGFVERLVWFWSNHFCVSADKGPQVRAMAGAYEREAIRAHATGRFADMLLAAESHPAMLIYLDNARSIGPNSVAGLRRSRGLNENLAREILELHTLGVRSVYSQEDVASFAKVLTGWAVRAGRDAERGGEFAFNAQVHEPGAHAVIGKRYPQAGVEQGRAVLADLARHPATARHLAGKLARHFVSDEPPAALTDRLARAFLDTDGDLKEVARTLVTAPESWNAPRSKLRRPDEWIVAAVRVTGQPTPQVEQILQILGTLGEPLWQPTAPKGFADDEGSWLDGVPRRLDVANLLVRRMGGGADVRDLAADDLAPLLSGQTRQALARAESRAQALVLLMMSPEIQRR